MAETTDNSRHDRRTWNDTTATGRIPAGRTAARRVPIQTPPRRGRGGWSLGKQIFAATAALVVFAILLAVAVTWFVGGQVGDEAARQALQRAGKVQLDFQENTFDLLGLMASLIAGDPDFSAYVQEAIDQGDVPSLLDQLDDRRQGLDFDFAMLLDLDGMLVVRTDDPSARRQDFSGEALFQEVRENYEAWGVWAREDRLFYAMAVPVVAGDALVAYLVTAYAIDDAAALRLRDVNNTEVAFVLTSGAAPSLAAKTLGPGAAGELLAYLAAHPQLGEDDFEVELQRQTWLASPRPLQNIGGETIGAVIHLTSLEIELEGFRRIGRTLLGVGILTMLLAVVISYWLPRRVLRPVHKLAAAAIDAAEGNFDQAIKIDRSDEVGQLAAAFDVLLSELREKRDMEIYVNELARTLPDSEGSGVVEASPPAERLATLAGIELRNYSPSGYTPMPANETLDHLTFDLRRISRAIRAREGKVEAVLGHRLVASFEGPQRSSRALGATAEILSNTGPRSLEIAAVLVSGSTVTGTTNWDQRPHYTLTGHSVDNLENLLRVARSGSLLISSEVREELRSTLAESGVGLQEHRSTVSELPLFSLSAKSAGRFLGPPPTATAAGATGFGDEGATAVVGDDRSPTRPMPGAGSPAHLPPTGLTPSLASVTLSSIGPGSVLANRFEILSELGAGGMGVVYKARDRTLGELVALKMLKQEMWGDKERLERLKDELKLARKISHPNVLRTFDFGDADGYPFISMEFVRGVTLRQVLDSSGRLPLSAGLHTARQLCRGLAAAHAQGVLHRDIKPENLIIEASGKVKLMDFGIARPLQRLGGGGSGQTRAGVIIGTPHYLAPEQLEGQEADARADLYACGIVLYEIFTGTLPFAATGSLMELITRKLQEPPTPPRQHWPAMPESLEQIILRCLQSDPAERFPDVASLLQELEVLRA